jgi:IclR family mhp operon transcriptional activator
LSGRRGYRLKSRVLELSRGYQHRDELIDAAIPFLQAFTQKHKWPVTLSTFESDAMVSKYSTLKNSPLSIEADKKWLRTPVTSSAVGLAWLAFCPEDEKQIVINTLAKTQRKSEFLARDKSRLQEILAQVKEDGYATNLFEANPGIGIAVPILSGEFAEAAVLCRCYRKAVSIEVALEQYLPDLRRLAGDVGAFAGTDPFCA